MGLVMRLAREISTIDVTDSCRVAIELVAGSKMVDIQVLDLFSDFVDARHGVARKSDSTLLIGIYTSRSCDCC